MKKIEVNEFISGDLDGAFSFKVDNNFALFYFQHLNYKNLSVLVDVKNLNSNKYLELSKKISNYFQGENDLLLLKIYGSSESLLVLKSFFKLKIYASIKDVACTLGQEVQIFPSLNKVKFKEQSNTFKIYDSEMDGAYKFKLSENQFFISFHHKSFKNFGALCDLTHLNEEIMKKFLAYMKSYFPDHQEFLIKILFLENAITKINNFPFSKYTSDLKIVSIQTSDEIQYFPSLNRVRLFKGESFEVIKASMTSLNVDRVVVIGGSTGAPNVLKQLLSNFPKHHCPILLAQHYPADQLVNFGNSVRDYSGTNVVNVQETLPLANNYIYLPSDHLNLIAIQGNTLMVSPENSGAINNFFPSIDLLFFSASRIKNKKILAILLTGMGNDGAKGILEIKRNGGITYGQNQESSVVFGMPNEAFKLKALNKLCSIEELKEIILDFCKID